MPEYLAPAVYVEEVDTGSKPIEGVSTSTAGMLGIAERGPVNMPILITSFGEYRRWFGDPLEITDYSNGIHHHCFLPHAVDGFFTNGGKRVYVERVESAGAVRASVSLFDRGQPGGLESALLRSADAGSGTAVNGPTISVAEPGALAAGDFIRVGDGSRAEYRMVASALTPSLQVPLQFALSHPHAQGAALDVFAAVSTGLTLHLSANAAPGAVNVRVVGVAVNDVQGVAIGQFLSFGGATPEYRFVSAVAVVDVSNFTVDVTLDSPLANRYAAGSAVPSFVAPPAPVTPPTLGAQALAGESTVFASSVPLTFLPGALLQIVGAQTEVRNIGNLRRLDLARGAYDAYAAGTRIDRLSSTPQQSQIASISSATLTLNSVAELQAGQSVLLDPTGVAVTHVVQSVNPATPSITLTVPPPASIAAGMNVQIRRRLTTGSPVGSTTLAIGNRVGIAAGDVLRLGVPGADEYVTVQSLLGATGLPPNAGTIVLEAATQLSHASGDDLVLQTFTSLSTVPAYTVLPLGWEVRNCSSRMIPGLQRPMFCRCVSRMVALFIMR